MPQDVAALVRDLPSSTNANASIRRAAAAFPVRFAAARSSPAVWSARVIVTAATMSASSPNQEGKRIMPKQPRESPNESEFHAAGISVKLWPVGANLHGREQ